MRILVCGSRSWSNGWAIERELLKHTMGYSVDRITVVHGGALGADRKIAYIADRMGMNLEAHLADWKRYGKSAGFKRNIEMAQLGAHVCLAFWDGKSKGTKHMIDTCGVYNIPVNIIREEN